MKFIIKKLSVHLIMFVFLTIHCYANTPSTNLHFIAGTPTTDGLQRYPTILFRSLNSNHLERVRAITTQTQGADFIVPYYDQAVVIIGNKSQKGFYQYDIIDMSTPNVEKSIEIKLCDNCNFGRSYILDKNGKDYLLVQAIQRSKIGKVVIQFLGYDLHSGKSLDMDETDIAYAQSFGASSGQFNHDHIEWLRSMNGRPMFYGTKENILPWQFPTQLRLNNKALVEQSVNNNKMRVITPHVLITKTKQKGQTLVHFAQDKSDKQWHKIELPNTTWVRGFGYWLATEQQTLGFTKHEALIKQHNSNDYHANANFKHYLERFLQWNIDKTGLLHIINPIQNIHIQLDTKASDSEVLLIENGEVIYRVEDKIYSAKIDGKQLTAPTLLVQSDEVPAIHWAFSSGVRQ